MFFSVFVIFNLILTFFPFTEWDAIAYHLPLAKIYATTHSVNPPLWMFHAQYPQLGEVLFGIGYILQDQASAETFVSLILIFFHHFFFIALYLFAKRVYNTTIALYALIIMYTIPEISIYITNPYVDIMTATYQFLTFIIIFYLLFDKQISKRIPYACIILAFMFSGICAGIKYTGLFMVFFALLFVILFKIINKKRFETKKTLLTTIIGLGIASIFFLPMYIKNVYFTNNPVWPFFTTIFSNTVGLNFELAHSWSLLFGSSVSAINPLFLPIYMTFIPSNIGSIYGIGPIFFMFIPIACFFLISKQYSFSRETCKQIITYLIISTIFLGIAYKTYFSYRVIFFSLILLTLIVAHTIYKINKEFPQIRTFIFFVFIVLIISNLFAYFVIYRYALPSLLLQEPINNLRYARTQVAEVDDYINTNTPKNATILLANDLRGYYIERNYVWGDPMTSLLYIDYRSIENSQQLYNIFKKKGITHIRISRFPQYNYTYGFVSEYYGEHITKLFLEFFSTPQYSQLIYEKNNVLLYKLN
jgi:hypothetical protein